MDAPRRSDASAQVLRNSQPEFRHTDATRHGSYQNEYFLSDVDGLAGMDACVPHLGRLYNTD